MTLRLPAAGATAVLLETIRILKELSG